MLLTLFFPVGEAFEIAAKSCGAIAELDARMCGFRKESEYAISENVARYEFRKKNRTARSH